MQGPMMESNTLVSIIGPCISVKRDCPFFAGKGTDGQPHRVEEDGQPHRVEDRA